MLIFIPCGKKKRDFKTEAKNMYIGSYFKNIYKAAIANFNENDIHIISANYGILKTTDIIEPYNITLNKMKKKKKN